ncbi:MAG: hypothetical protein V2A54_07070 [Bacteroidota bacterium]
MKKLISIVLPLMLLLACKQTKVEQVIEEKFPSGNKKVECWYKGEGESREKIKEIRYTDEGKVEMEGEFKNNKKDGKWVVYHPNGIKWSEGYFKEGKADGKRTVYHTNGKVRYEGEYKAGEPSGVWSIFDFDGKMIKVVDYTKRNKDSIRNDTMIKAN